MKYKKTFKIIQYTIGLLILTLGLSMLISTNLGPTSWDSVSIGISQILNTSVGVGTTITGILIVIFVALLTKTKPNIIVILISFVTGLFINMWLFILEPLEIDVLALYIRFFISFIGLIFSAIGINLYVKAQLIPNPIDFLMVTICSKFKISFFYAKLITDTSGLTIGLLIGGPVAVFTIVTMVFLGIFVGIFEKVYNMITLKKRS